MIPNWVKFNEMKYGNSESALDFIDRTEILNIWAEVATYGPEAYHDKWVVGPSGAGAFGHVANKPGIYFTPFENDGRFKISKMQVYFAITNPGIKVSQITTQEVGNRTYKSFGPLSKYNFYDDLVEANERTLDYLKIDEKNCEITIVVGKNLSEVFDERSIYFLIEYDCIESYLKMIEKEYQKKGPFFSARRVYNPIKDKNIDSPIAKNIKRMHDDEEEAEAATDVWRSLYTYGLEYDHDVKKAKKLNFYNLCNNHHIESRKVFFMMCLAKDYKNIDYLRDFDTHYFEYSDSTRDELAFDIMMPMFKACMQSEILWEVPEEELAILFLTFVPKLLLERLETPITPSFLISLFDVSFHSLLATLILYNRKESMTFLVNEIKKAKKLSKDEKRELKDLVEDARLYSARIKSKFDGDKYTRSYLKIRGFTEVPDFDFFKEKARELSEFADSVK